MRSKEKKKKHVRTQGPDLLHGGADDEEVALDTKKNQGTTAAAFRPTILRSDHGRAEPMTISAYKIRPDNCQLEKLTLEDALDGYKQQEELLQSSESPPAEGVPDTTYWIDVDVRGNATDEILLMLHTKILDHLVSMPEFLRRHVKSERKLHTTQVWTLSRAALVVMRILAPSSTNDILHTSAICLDHMLVTITMAKQSAVSKLSYRQRSLLDMDSIMADVYERELPHPSVSGAVVVWLAVHIERTASTAYALRDELLEKLELLDRDDGAASLSLKEILELKDTLLRVSSVAEEQNQTLHSLCYGDEMTDALTFADCKGSLGLLISSAKSTERMTSRLEKRMADLKQGYDARQQDLINRRLSLLTIMSSVFLPLTLMAGLWGMNFTNMPELRGENGYYYALASMAFVGLSLLFFFYKNGWFEL
jgi:Mg2+ and Co2+ transporter CorA